MQTLNEAYNARINLIHDQYTNIISPFIMQIEVLDGEFPVEIINEIRAVFGHLSKCHLSTDDSVVERNLAKADSHIKRAIIDCYKYLCFAYDDNYKEFERKYIDVDLSEIDNGEFLPFLCKKRKLAIDKLVLAKKLELSTSEESILYSNFEEAYNAYADVYNFVNNSFEKLE
ncbi:MAG: hypothetical protein LBH20_00285, partial [Treponema sp.]|nr:hypothetical protein [Treponema sp.]